MVENVPRKQCMKSDSAYGFDTPKT